MSDRSIDWSSSYVDSEGVLSAPLSGDPDDFWAAAFQQHVAALESEVRGQSWRGMRLIRDAILVHGVDEHTDTVDLQRYLDNAVTIANEQAPRLRDRAAAEQTKHAQAEADRTEEAERLTERFRTPPA